MARAVRDGEIIPWFQPVVDLRTGDIVGLEALARWQRSDGQVDSPQAFIGVAERSTLILDVDFAVIGQALANLARWHRAMPALRLSLNLSGRHLDRPDWVDRVRGAVEAAGVSPSRVDLELTETARPADVGASRAAIQNARDAGFRVWLDDFGSGWSTLQELVSLPVDGIKLDRTFVRQLGHRGQEVVIRALISAASEIGLAITIEGIETSEEAALARAVGCDYAQGFLWSPAVPASAVDQVMPGFHSGSIRLDVG